MSKGENGFTVAMDDLSNHFYVTVGQLLDQAALGRLRVRIELVDGAAVDGVPFAPGADGEEELDDTGYASRVQIDGAVVPLEQVRSAVVFHPGDVLGR